MKKILLILISVSTLAIASNSELKIGLSLGGLVKESARYEYKTDKNTLEDTRLTKKNNMGGDVTVKYSKLLKLSDSYNLKYGVGLSYEFNKTPLLTTGFKHIHKSDRNTVELFGDGSSLNKTSFLENENFLDKLKTIRDDQKENPSSQYDTLETVEGVKKHIKIAENTTHHFLTPTVNLEIEAVINEDLSIYTGFNIGPRILLNKQYHSFNFNDSFSINTYTLERETKKVDLKAKALLGLNYKNAYIEAGISYPKKIDLGMGLLLKFK